MADIGDLDPEATARADLLDLGAGTGRWLENEARRLGVEHPVGVDINRGKVEQAQAAGRPVYLADFITLDPDTFPAVKIVVFDNVLEHLPSLDVVETAVERACAIASHVVYIRHPSFEDVDYLAGLGLKQYWTDWPGVHTAPVRLQELIAIALRNGVYDFAVRPLKRAFRSDDPTILPASAPSNQTKRKEKQDLYGLYEEAKHGPKPLIEFDRPVYFAFDVFLFLRSDAPQVRYRRDTDNVVTRPFLTWSGREGPPVVEVPRRAAGVLKRKLQRYTGGFSPAN
jgi:SAM-dependent methyltransferase